MRSTMPRIARFAVSVATVAGVAIFVADPGFAQAQLPTDIAASLERAANAGGGITGAPQDDALITAVIAAIAARPDLAQTIVTRATSLARSDPQQIVNAAAQAFPGLPIRSASVASSGAWSAQAGGSPWSGEFAVGGSKNTGNSETTDISLGAKLGYTSDNWHHEASASYEFASDKGQETENRLEAEGSTRYDFAERTYVKGRVTYENDDFSGFDYRLTESVALGYRLIDTDDVTWALEAGPGARHSKEELTGDVETEFVGVAQSDFRWKLSETADFSNVTRVTTGRETTTTKSTTALDLKVFENITGRFSFEVRHDSNPPTGTDSTDTTTKVSAVYTF